MSDKELMRHCREFISCECCGEGNPKQRCSRCHCVYYCSRKCQTNHWKRHKPGCTPIEYSKSIHELGVVGRICMEADDEARRQVLEGNPQCAICFEQPIARPIVLDKCHHAFCSTCLRNWNSIQPTITSTCPLCRQEIPNLTLSTSQDITVLLTSADKANASKSFRDKQLTKALEKMELLKEIIEAEDDIDIATALHHQLLDFQFLVHKVRKEYDKALEVAKQSAAELRTEVLNSFEIEKLEKQLASMELVSEARTETERKYETLKEKPHALPVNHIYAMLKVANMHVLQKDWGPALMSFFNILRLYCGEGQCPPHHEFEVCVGLSRGFCECESYDAAIEHGLNAITISPCLPGSRQYVVLAYLAVGNKKREAQQCAAAAVIFEAPWDEEHQAKTKEFYRQHFLR
jgi:tetratricopeptide (TPR) repeat protein